MSDITSEMKAECMGKFGLSYEDICPKCVLGDDGPCMCNSDHNGVFTNTRAVPWDLCKQIFKTMYALSPAAQQLAALKEENERLKAGLGVCEYELMISTSENLARDYIALKARVAELEGRAISTDGRLQGARLVAQRFMSQFERLKSVGAIMSNACYNMSQWGERLPEGQAEVLKGLYKAWDEAIKEPANEG